MRKRRLCTSVLCVRTRTLVAASVPAKLGMQHRNRFRVESLWSAIMVMSRIAKLVMYADILRSYAFLPLHN